MEASIQEVARLTGLTSRTLRHYDAIGLLTPSRTGHGGTRWYDEDALVRLQRVLLLRDLGLPLPEIRRVLDREQDEGTALRRHLNALRGAQDRLARQAASVERTLTAREAGTTLMTEDMFDGFDHTHHQAEVERRWGPDAYAASGAWWRAKDEDAKAGWREASARLAADWAAAAEAGVTPGSPAADELARRHVEWLAGVPGTPGHGTAPVAEYVVGLGEMYVADPRFAAQYGGEHGAAFVRDALRSYAEREL